MGAEVVGVLDPRVVQLLGDLQLAPEPVEGRGVAHDGVVRALQDHPAALRVYRQVDVAEGAVADDFSDLEAVEVGSRLDCHRGHHRNLTGTTGASPAAWRALPGLS